MPPTVALCLCAGFILWLFRRDGKEHGNVSRALWIPLVWLFVISSRPVSAWLDPESAAPPIHDKFVDKAVFAVLISAGVYVLSKRHLNWKSLIRENKWVLVYFLYLGLSTLWADDSLVSLRRWIKDAGIVVMVLVVLTEENPIEAVGAFLSRCGYLLLPLSVLILKYYPALGQRYDPWGSATTYVGVAMEKNGFGMALFVCGTALIWMLLRRREARSGEGVMEKTAVFRYFVLLVMCAWLLYKARSSTALSCTVLAGGVLLALRVPALRRRVKHLGAYAAALAAGVILFQATGIWSIMVSEFAKAVGRDPTLHGRAQIWEAVLKEEINPVIGAGFYSFWSPERNRRLSEEYYYSLGEAHNGYIETYLNSGVIGLLLFAVMVAVAAKGIKRDVIRGSSLGDLRLAFLIAIAAYGLSESLFDRLAPTYFAFLLVITECCPVGKKLLDHCAGGKAWPQLPSRVALDGEGVR